MHKSRRDGAPRASSESCEWPRVFGENGGDDGSKVGGRQMEEAGALPQTGGQGEEDATCLEQLSILFERKGLSLFFFPLSLSLSLSTFLRGRYLRLIVKEQVQGLPRI